MQSQVRQMLFSTVGSNPSVSVHYGRLQAKFSYGASFKLGYIFHHIINFHTQFGVAVGSFKLNELDVFAKNIDEGGFTVSGGHVLTSYTSIVRGMLVAGIQYYFYC